MFLVPTTWYTLAADASTRGQAIARGGVYASAVSRLAFTLALLLLLRLLLRQWPGARVTLLARELLPFVACVLVYTNLHDTLGFVRDADIHPALAAFDQALFGVQPTVWAERFVSPGLTELMNLCYWSFGWIAPLVPLALLLRGRLREMRTATFGIVLCFFFGYALYVAFPARPPWVALAGRYSVDLGGYTLSHAAAGAMALLPTDSRAAFPSLHTAISLLSLYYAARFLRPLAWLIAPFVLGLLVATVYLRHHFVADLLAGAALAPCAAWLAPRIDAAWARAQRAHGLAPALGAP